jgi:hypothetical protein
MVPKELRGRRKKIQTLKRCCERKKVVNAYFIVAMEEHIRVFLLTYLVKNALCAVGEDAKAHLAHFPQSAK